MQIYGYHKYMVLKLYLAIIKLKVAVGEHLNSLFVIEISCVFNINILKNYLAAE